MPLNQLFQNLTDAATAFHESIDTMDKNEWVKPLFILGKSGTGLT